MCTQSKGLHKRSNSTFYSSKKNLACSTKRNKRSKKEIIERLQEYKIHVLSVPSLNELISGKKLFTELEEICIQEILGREKKIAQILFF